MQRKDFLRANPVRPKKRALLLFGGWQEHFPEAMADFAEEYLLFDFDVVRAQTLAVLNDDVLSAFDLIVPIWTFGELNEAQQEALFDAVSNGLGLIAWHGFASAFLSCREHKHLLGGQFVAHPGSDSVTYDVRFDRNEVLAEDLKDFSITSEQYYMLIDPAVKVIASTVMQAAEMPWLSGVEMPVAWTRSWGAGRVFYCSLGHTVDVLAHPSVTTLLQRAAHWASENVKHVEPLQLR